MRVNITDTAKPKGHTRGRLYLFIYLINFLKVSLLLRIEGKFLRNDLIDLNLLQFVI